MAASKPPVPPDLKQKLFLGVEIPLPWLVGIVVALFFNAGVLYSQFDVIKKQNDEFTKLMRDLTVKTDQVERRIERIDDRNAFQATQILDHERRLRDMERPKR